MSDIEEIKSPDGVLRRLGSLVIPQGMVCSAPVYDDEFDVWDDADIRKVIADPDRVPSRKIYTPDEWIDNQQSHGSCNGFAAAGAYSRLRYFLGHRDGFHASGAWIYSLINGGRDQGSQLIDGMTVGQDVGYASRETVTWDMIYPRQQPLAKAKAEAAKHKGRVYYQCRTLQAFRTGLAQGWPGVAAVHVGNNYMRFRNGIAGVDRGPGNHAVCVDDLCLHNGTEVFDQPGSWGVNGGGEAGRWRLTKDHFAETFGHHQFYILRGTKG